MLRRRRYGVVLSLVVAMLAAVLTESPALGEPATRARYVVVFEPGNSAEALASVIRGPDDRVEGVLNRVFSGAVVEMTTQRAAAWSRNPNVTYLEPASTITVATSQSSPPWGLDRIDQATLPLNGTYGYDSTGSDVRAYVVDTGISASHPDLAGRVTAGFSAVEGGDADTDCNGHGTHVAGTIAGTTYGVAKAVRLVPVQVFSCAGSGTTLEVINALEWILGNHVPGQLALVNMSLGGGVSTALDAAVDAVIDAGIPVIVAAGNESVDACTVSPARTPRALTVGASTVLDRRASFSNTGSCVDLFAPGHDIVSTWIDGTQRSLSGTSMATPHVAGVVARLMSETGISSPSALHQTIVDSAQVDRLSDIGTGSPNRLVHIAAPVVDGPVVDEPSTPTVPSDPVTPPISDGGSDGPADGGEAGTVTIPAPASPETPVEVAISALGGDGRLRFDGLAGSGRVTLTERAGRPAGGRGLNLPMGFVDLDYSGSPFTEVDICLPGGSRDRLYHFPDGGGRRDVTTGFDSSTGLVCGRTSEFSAFATGTLDTIRLSGADRYATAVAVSTFRNSAIAGRDSSIVFLANGESDADALAAGAAAAAADAVVLLTRKDSLPPATSAELARRRPREIVVVGGPSAIADSVVEAAIVAAPDARSRRVFGATRYATAVELSAMAFPSGSDVVYVATGLGYADALAGSAAAGREGGPILLVPGTSTELPAEVRAEVQRLSPSRVVLLGGEAAVSAGIERSLQTAAASASLVRIAGVDRFDTASQVVDYCENRVSNAGTVFLATGLGFADALAAAAVAGAGGCPVLITRDDSVPEPVRRALVRLAPARIVVLGGTAAITEETELELASFLPG